MYESMVLALALLITIPLVWVVSGYFAATIYVRKGHSELVGWLVGLSLGPLGVLLVMVTPEKPRGDLRECPFCYERIDVRASVCPNCKSHL